MNILYYIGLIWIYGSILVALLLINFSKSIPVNDFNKYDIFTVILFSSLFWPFLLIGLITIKSS